MKARTLLVLLAFVTTVGPALTLAAIQAPDLSGTWSGPVVLDTNAIDKMTAVLERTGSKYKGTISDEMGIVAAGTELRDIVLKDKALSFAFNLPPDKGSLLIKVNVVVESDKMKGRWEDQQNGSGGAVEMARVK
jgi:hypothetical protein